MTPSEDDEDVATEEAALWVLALEENPDDPHLHARFEAWLSRDPRHAAAWADASRIYDMYPQTTPAHSEHWAPYVAAHAADGPKVAGRGDRSRAARCVAVRTGGRAVRRRFALGAVGLALAACLAIALLPGVMLRVQADHITSTAEMHTLNLEDGTKVSLAPESAIAVDFEKGERRVRLLSGEAFFDVEPDPARPFRVTADALNVTVLGTAFNLRMGDRAAGVAVREGRVGVSLGDDGSEQAPDLTAGDWVFVDQHEEVWRGRVSPDEIGSWREGRIIARDLPMSEVLDDLRRHHVGFIVLTDEALGERRVTGIYNLDDPIAAVRVLARPLGATVRQMTPLLLVVSPE